MVVCSNHTEAEAAGACVYCGKLFCADCLVDVNGKNHCKMCIGKAFTEQKSSSATPNINIINTNNNNNANNNMMGGGLAVSPKSRLVAFLLCFFLGYFGIHRFYVGKMGTGIIYLLSGGIFGIGALLDCISILLGTFRDSAGLQIKNW